MLSNFKLIKVGHSRCGDVYEFTYLLAPTSKTDKEIEEDIDKAVDTHRNACLSFNALKKPKYMTDSINQFSDNLTVAEAKVALANNKEEYQIYEKAKREASRSFGCYMMQYGYQLLNYVEDLPEFTAYWGHHHGEYFDTSETTEINFEPNGKNSL